MEKCFVGLAAMATQFGHFSVDRNGPLCACGNHGCVERVVGKALTERAEACGIDLTRFAGRKPLYCDIGAMAEDGGVHAKELIKDLAVDLSFAISNLITLFNPSLVVIGGMGVNLGRSSFPTSAMKYKIAASKSLLTTPGSSILRWGWIPSLAVLQDIILITTTISLNRCKAAYTLTDAEKRLEIMMPELLVSIPTATMVTQSMKHWRESPQRGSIM